MGTHEGITADLEAFKQQGVGGVVYYDQVHGNGDGAFKVLVDFSGISSNGFFALPKLLPFTPEFNLGAILSVIAIYLVSATETVGDSSALCSGALKRQIHKVEMGG
ncbi:MAG: hypothetical protein II107_00595, partial [Prevotella sp.]|nr:hypothetical protein [Prevotella sp.]